MITRNFTAQAAWALLQFKDTVSDNDALQVYDLVQTINDATHFQLPENGNIFDDVQYAASAATLNMAFDLATGGKGNAITVDFSTPVAPEPVPGYLIVDHHVVVVDRIPKEQLADYVLQVVIDNSATFIYRVRSVVHLAQANCWLPCNVGLMLADSRDTTGQLISMPFEALPDHIQNLCSGEAALYRSMLDDGATDAATYAAVILDMFEALLCVNVGHERVAEVNGKRNQKRLSEGRCPVFEYRRLMVYGAILLPNEQAGPLDVGRISNDRWFNAPRLVLPK
jgi:hypothetical protein